MSIISEVCLNNSILKAALCYNSVSALAAPCNLLHTCQLFLFWRNSSSFRSKKENDFIMCSCFCSNLCIVMYRKFRNVPLFNFFSLICSSFWNLKVGKYAVGYTTSIWSTDMYEVTGQLLVNHFCIIKFLLYDLPYTDLLIVMSVLDVQHHPFNKYTLVSDCIFQIWTSNFACSNVKVLSHFHNGILSTQSMLPGRWIKIR